MVQHHYFMGGSTAKGYVQFYDNAVEQLDHVIYLDGGFTTILTPLLERMIHDYSNETTIDVIHNHIMPNHYEGVIFPDRRVGIFDRTKMQPKRMALPGLKDQLIYFGDGYALPALKQERQTVTALQRDIRTHHHDVIRHFDQALKQHHQVEAIYLDYLNVRRANEQTDELIDTLLQDNEKEAVGHVKHRYLGAATPEGPVDYVMELTEDITKRYFIKGRSGTGKSTMLRKLAHEANDRGFDVEVYHCGFDPGSLDMVIVRELDFAIFDATAPHQHTPKRKGDLIYDVYERFIDGHPDALHRKKLGDYKQAYQQEMAQAADELKQLQEKQQELESIYRKAMREDFFEDSYRRIRHWIDNM
ncbi:hypothetical protein ABID56_002319 [Alkalibacillus flavidus]|uniref:Uncharacterized protein n=1 Tax=Alkalibacillus flavidus TaxID=546021 RepID=A0ABV2KX92_9BACI